MNAEQLPQNNFSMLAEDTRHPERQPILFQRRWDKILKIKRETKELGTETCHAEGVMKEEKFPNSRKTLTGRFMGSFGSQRAT